MLPHTEDTGEPIMRGEKTHEIPHIDLLTWLFSNDAYDHTKTIFVDAIRPERSMSTEDVKSMVKSMIGGLKSTGVKPGDAVCIQSFNDIMYPVMFLAIIGAGGRFVGTNPGHTILELDHHLRISHTKYIIAQPSLMGNIKQAAAQIGIDSKNIIAFDTEGQVLKIEDGIRSYKELLKHGQEDWISFSDEKIAKQTIMGLFASSGTTGLPKVISISHYAWVAGSILLREVLERPYEVKRLMCLPSFHGFAAPLTIGVPLRLGQTTYILPRFELEAFCNAAANNQINETAVAPPCLQAFLKSPPETQNKLKTIKRVWCGGAPLNIKLQAEARNCFSDDAEIVNIWGMTEIGITVGMKYDDVDHSGAASKLLANTEARIVDDLGVNVTHSGEQGEVQIRTPQSSLGYLGDEKATNETFIANGWVRTGDVAYFRDGKLYILDRKKEMIKVRGWQVAPAELEAVLVSHPGIKDAAVIGITVGTDGELHEVPRAYIVRMEGSEITGDEVKEFILSKLSRYKALEGGVFFVDAIPKSAAGKILKKIIRAEWLATEEKKPLA
ncbi:S-dihydroxybenzoyltransferase [Dactylellina cionopaga]|nr:S-dihydroxybenzoyltransferase [Dactylellina cionopaga]